MKYKAVLFDMDGVIVDSEPLHRQAFEVVFNDYGVVLTDDDFKTFILGKTDVRGVTDYLAHLGMPIDVLEFVGKKAKAYYRLAEKKLVAYPGVVELIRELASQVPLALVTGSLGEEANLVLKTLDIDDCFDIIVTADDVVEGKPDPEGYLQAAGLLNKAPADCLVVEDSPAGVAAAKTAGIDCTAVASTHSKAELAGADLVVERIDEELLDIIKSGL